MWIILGIIFFVFQLFILKNSYEIFDNEDVVEPKVKLKLSLWKLLVLIGVNMMPIVNLLCFIAFLIFYFVHGLSTSMWEKEVEVIQSNSYMGKYRDRKYSIQTKWQLTKKLGKILNKEF